MSRQAASLQRDFMKPSTTRWLLNLHRWCGVAVSANLLILALTGVILIFHDEIDDALGVVQSAQAGNNHTSLARAIELARAAEPGAHAVFLFADEQEHPGIAFVGMAKSSRKLDDATPLAIDLRQGKLLPRPDFDGSFTGIVLRLHAELFAGPVGRLLVGLVALALLVSLTTGAIVYGPMMKRFAFGLVRRDRARRTLLADLHKLVGAATFGWILLVSVTGLFLSLGSVALQVYSATELKTLGAPFAKQPIVEDLQTVDAAVESAERATQGAWSIIALPGSDLASPRHYTVLLKGGSGVSSRMLTLALVDALAPEHAEAHQLPLYLKGLLLSEPLHFGDYGGLPLKLVWTLFSLATVVLSASGVWVFFIGRRDRGPQISAANLR
jgi:uncharacterized iron-regulated membrane protein